MQGAVGYCAAKEKKYFGFKGHLLTTQEGLILDLALVAANIDERQVLPELIKNKIGDLIADKGLISQELVCKAKDSRNSTAYPLKR